MTSTLTRYFVDIGDGRRVKVYDPNMAETLARRGRRVTAVTGAER